MKLNWFSPLPPTMSDIANYTLRVLPALSEGAEVVMWTTQTTWSSELELYGQVRQYSLESMPWGELNQADLNIYHIGNHPLYHHEIWEVSQRCSGLVVLHDGKLQHLFAGIYDLGKNWAEYSSQMKRYYGTEGEQAVEDLWDGIVTIDWMAERYPLTALALKNSVGAITHNRQVYQQLKQEYPHLSGYIPLPYPGKLPLPLPQHQHQEAPYQLIIFGHLGANRRLEVVLEALATFNQKGLFKLDIYGQIWNENYIQQYIHQLNLDGYVTIRGFVAEEELEAALASADLAINLRYPTMGEASGSQLRIWSHALPSLVTQTGWYGELPEDTVAFVRLEQEIEDIHQHLQKFLNNQHYYREIGHNGLKYLKQEHNPEDYVESLLDLASQACSLRHRSIVAPLTERVGEKISHWNSGNWSDGVMQNVVEAISFLSAGELKWREWQEIGTQQRKIPPYGTIFAAYEFYQGEGREYIKTHFKRYLATLKLISQKEDLQILELGTSYAFSLMLKHEFPDGTIVLAENGEKFETNSPEPSFSEIELKSLSQDWPSYRFPCASFNIETDIWPFEDGSFDVVLSMEILEHLLVDPCFSFREANRVLKDGGAFILTTPNIARYESVANLLKGVSPYTFGIYSQYGPYGRHNREYVPHEVARLGECSGFRTDLLLTQDVYPQLIDIQEAKKILDQDNDDPKMRGQTIFYRGIKITDEFAPYPAELYG